MRNYYIFLSIISFLALSSLSYAISEFSLYELNTSLSRFPKIVLWAWERPEDLRFINPEDTGVAFLSRTFHLRGEDAICYPRFQPLRVPSGTFLMAVIRIESHRFQPPELSYRQRAKIAEEIAGIAKKPGVFAIQIDFDAKVSERDFYRDLLFDIRRQLPDSMPLSITALASWCIYDNWLSDLPVDEAVPMLFRMGADKKYILQYLESGGDFRPSLCKGSLGISTDEVCPNFPPGRRIYIFHPGKWSPEAFGKIINEVNKR